MIEYIKREDVIAAVKKCSNSIRTIQRIEKIPAADVVERKKGVWLYYGWIKCSECGTRYSIITKVYPNYCPNCGADMLYLK